MKYFRKKKTSQQQLLEISKTSGQPFVMCQNKKHIHSPKTNCIAIETQIFYIQAKPLCPFVSGILPNTLTVMGLASLQMI